jgi:hypothetical protein
VEEGRVLYWTRAFMVACLFMLVGSFGVLALPGQVKEQ